MQLQTFPVGPFQCNCSILGDPETGTAIVIDPGDEAEAITEALAAAGLPDARATAGHEEGRLVVTVTGGDPGRVRDAVAGFALTVRCGLSPAPPDHREVTHRETRP